MKNIKNLTKIYLLQIFYTNFASLKKSKKPNTKSKKLTTVLLIGMLFAYIFFSIFMMYFGYGEALKTHGLTHYLFLVGMVFSNLLLLLILTFEIHGHFFKHKDYNLISSMPIPAYQVVISKFASIFLFAILYQTMFLLPAIAALIAYNAVSVIGIIYFFVGFSFMPLFMIAVSTLLALLLNLYLSYFKPSGVLSIIVSFVLMIGLMGLMYFTNTQMLNLVIASNGMPTFLYYAMPTGVLYFLAVTGSNLGWFVLYVLTSLFVGAIAVFALSLTYNKINKWYGNSRSKQKKGKVEFKQKHVLASLLKQEFYRYTQSSIYIFNTFIGMVILLAASVAGTILYFANPEIIALIPSEFVFGIVALIIISTTALSITTNVSVSVEGNTLYVKKSLPISFRHIVLAKLMLNWIVCLPMMLLSLAVLTPVFISINLSIWAVLGLVIIAILTLLAFSLFGLMVNLWFPKLEFTTDTEVVKQSVSVLITVMTGMAFTALLAVVYVQLLASVMSIYWFALVVSGFLTVTSIAFAWLIQNKGKQLYFNL